MSLRLRGVHPQASFPHAWLFPRGKRLSDTQEGGSDPRAPSGLEIEQGNRVDKTKRKPQLRGREEEEKGENTP